MSVVYFIASEDRRFVKIGSCGRDPRARLSEIQTCCPLRLELLVNVEGGTELERRIHDTFRRCKVRGEWFEMRGKLRDFVNHLIEHRDVARAVAEVVVLGVRDHETANPALWPEIVMEVV